MQFWASCAIVTSHAAPQPPRSRSTGSRAAGTATDLNEDDIVHTAPGAGDTPAVVMGTLLLTTGAPLLIPAEDMAGMDMDATPAP